MEIPKTVPWKSREKKSVFNYTSIKGLHHELGKMHKPADGNDAGLVQGLCEVALPGSGAVRKALPLRACKTIHWIRFRPPSCLPLCVVGF